MNLKKKLIINLILIILVLLMLTGSTYAASLFDNLSIRSTNVFTMQTLGAAVGDRFDVSVTIGGIQYAIKYEVIDASKNYVEVSNCNDNITGEFILPATVSNKSTRYTVTGIGQAAFMNCINLTSVTIPSSVTVIEDYAFKECSSLTSVTIPEGVTSIGFGAFDGCSNLTSVTIPSTVINIEGFAFDGCSNLTSVTIPEGVTSIESHLFNRCIRLTNVTIPEGVTSIGDYAFYECRALESVTIPEGVTSIGASAFSGCRSLESVTIPSTVTSIEEYSFYRCSNLTNVTILEGVTSIGVAVFKECSNLTSVTIPEGVTSIGDSAFYYCENLENVTIPSSVTSIGESVFNLCRKLLEINVDENNANYSSIDGVLFSKNKKTLIRYPEGKETAYYIIPDEVTHIEAYAFYFCSNLETIELPESITYTFEGSTIECVMELHARKSNIGDDAFSGCQALKSIICKGRETLLPFGEGQLIEVGPDLNGDYYWKCEGNHTNTSGIQNGVTIYGFNDSYAKDYTYYFSPNKGITSTWGKSEVDYEYEFVLLEEETLTYEYYGVETDTEEDNTATVTGMVGEISEITIPITTVNPDDGKTYTVNAIKANAFEGCENLNEVIFHDTIKSIGAYAFNDCTNLTKVLVEEYDYSLDLHDVELGEYAFANSGITGEVVIGSTSKGVFENCINLTSLLIPPADLTMDNIQIGEGAFNGCTSLSSVDIYDNVTSIGDAAFANCDSLEKIGIPDSVTVINEGLFRDCDKLYSVSLGNVTSIGKKAFYMCLSLENIIISNTVEAIEEGAFWNSGLTSIKIPESVGEIGKEAFAYCQSLDGIYIYNGEVEIGEDAFASVPGVLYGYGYENSGIIRYIEKYPDFDMEFQPFSFIVKTYIPDGGAYIEVEEAEREVIVGYKDKGDYKIGDIIGIGEGEVINPDWKEFNGYKLELVANNEPLTEINITDGIVNGKEANRLQIDLVYKEERKYTVTWLNEDGTVLETDENVPYGSVPSYDRENPTMEVEGYTYTFQGWDKDITAEVIGDVTYTAIYTVEINKYTILFETPEGGIIKELTEEYGTKITAPDAAREGYTFISWSPEVPETMPAENMTITANYKINQYTITFDTDGGSKIAPITQDYDTVITAPADPIKTGYTFAGWDREIPEAMPAEDITITAKWTINKYTVTWKNYDGTVLETDENVPYGTVPSYDGATPTKPSDAENTYRFSQWSPKVSSVTGNVTYTATFVNTKNKYEITWKKDENTIIKTEDVLYGEIPSCEEPTRDYYTFNGWNPEVVAVTGEATYTATWKPIKDADGDEIADEEDIFEITWKKDEDTVIKTEDVLYGEIPSCEEPTRDYYTFNGWNPEVVAVTGEATYTATWKAIKDADGDEIADEEDTFAITWENEDGTVLETDTNVAYGATPSYNGVIPSKAATAEYRYEFAGWTPEIAEVTEDVTYTATYTEILKTTIIEYEVIEKGENKFLKGIKPYTKWIEAKSRFIGYTSLFAERKSGDYLKDNELVGTGIKITANDKTYTAVVSGDVTGDGKIDIYDIIEMVNLTYYTGAEAEEWNNGVKEASLYSSKDWEKEDRFPNIIDIIEIINEVYEPVK